MKRISFLAVLLSFCIILPFFDSIKAVSTDLQELDGMQIAFAEWWANLWGNGDDEESEEETADDYTSQVR